MTRLLSTATDMFEVRKLLDRRAFLTEEGGILKNVRERGNDALIEYTMRFDKVALSVSDLRVTEYEIERAVKRVSPEFMEALRLAKKNIENFHRRQLAQSWVTFEDHGIMLGQRIIPIDRVGLYVPGGAGGTTPLVSTFLMNAIPALVAGVKNIIVCTPPKQDRSVDPHLLAAAKEVGVTEIYKVGGAQAVAAMAFGTATVPRVDKIVGPGNAFVTTAKRQVYGYVGLDTLAGPSEILVIADDSANPAWVASDLLSQAEHGPKDEAGAILLTPSMSLAKKVLKEIDSQLVELNKAEIAANSLERSGGLVVTNDLEEAIELANFCAPEHLELYLADPFAWLGKIRHAGAVFLGPYSPEPIGDYVAGTNHVLPTMVLARYASALSVEDFVKKTSFISYTKEALAAHGPAAVTLARAEGLEAHARSVEERLKKMEG